MFTLSACDDNKSSAGNIAYDVSGGSGTISEVFGDLDEDNFTYRDIAPAVIPDALLGLEGEHAQKARDIAQSFNDFIASPDASSAPSGKSGSRATRSVEPDCYNMGGLTYLCIYQWQDGGLICTLHEIHSPDVWTLTYFAKGEWHGITYPGDMNNPDDPGYPVQYHTYGTDARSALIQTWMYPNTNCANLPVFEYGFKVEGEGTLYTPWGETQLCTYIYTSNIYVCDWPDQGDWTLSIGSTMKAFPDGDLEMEVITYSLKHGVPYISWKCWYDASEFKFSWATYDEDGNCTGTSED